MAGPVGNFQISNSLTSLQNENSLSLLNARLDLALIKVEPPAEYLPVAINISRKRKELAEEGSLHRTARKLGKLFDTALPQTPNLLRAYGRRVSEISAQTSINPQGSVKKDGIFAPHVGVDAGSLWAAATSGPGAISVHLLACVLARMFTTVEHAISIWVELVEDHKKFIISEVKDSIDPEAAVLRYSLAQQEISRHDLAEWDASARAWLQSADQARAVQHKQMELILHNAGIPVDSDRSVYESVLSAWKTALQAMENLILGMPQKVHDGAALLAISAWHLYPDLMVFKDKAVEVKQNDDLFAKTALLTLGLEPTRQRSVSWSLPLNRLRYYGGPMRVSECAGQENTRITADEFSYVLLGCMFSTWGPFGKSPELGTLWLELVLQCLSQERQIATPVMGEDDSGTALLVYLVCAVKSLVAATTSTDLNPRAMQLYKLGVRRLQTYLPSGPQTPCPVFDLSNPITLATFLLDWKDKKTAFAQLDCILVQKLSRQSNSSKRSAPETTPATMVRTDWVRNSRGGVQWPIYTNFRPQGKIETQPLGTDWVVLNQSDIEDIASLRRVPELHRAPFPVERHIYSLNESTNITYLPAMYLEVDPREAGPSTFTLLFSSQSDFRSCLEELADYFELLTSLPRSKRPRHLPNVSSYMIVPEMSCHLYCRSDLRGELGSDGVHLDETSLQYFLQPSKIDSGLLRTYFQNQSIDFKRRVFSNQAELLHRWKSIACFYDKLPGATINTKYIDVTSKWVSNLIPQDKNLGLCKMFCLLCYMECGKKVDPLHLKGVFALSMGNSIFVASQLLCDPSEMPTSVLKRVPGNVGRPGLCFLVVPPEPRVAPRDEQNWTVINHNPFDGTTDDLYGSTSVHLSFTEWVMPLQPLNNNLNHQIDRPINLVETLLSVFQGTKWVADLDIMKAMEELDHKQGGIRQSYAPCNNCTVPHSGPFHDSKGVIEATAIDCWDELLDPPSTQLMAVRATGNWVARLALTTVSRKLDFFTIVAPPSTCIKSLLQSAVTQLQNLSTTTAPHQSQRHSSEDFMETGADAGTDSVTQSGDNANVVMIL